MPIINSKELFPAAKADEGKTPITILTDKNSFFIPFTPKRSNIYL